MTSVEPLPTDREGVSATVEGGVRSEVAGAPDTPDAPDAREQRPLETGWLDDTPVADTLLRRFVVGFASWIETSGRAAGHPVLRTPDVVAVDEHADHLLLNSGILLRPLGPDRAGDLLAELTAF